MNYDIEEINKLEIVKTAHDLGFDVKKRGSTFMVRCPWHEDTNPSMQLFPKTRTAHCYVCCRTTNVWGLIKSQGLPPKIPLPVLDNEYQTGYKTRKKESLLAKPKVCHRNDESFYVFPSDSMDGKMTMENSFVRCLIGLFGKEKALEVMRMYRLGSWPAHGRYPDVMFPSIDQYGRIRDIKIQAYDCDDRSPRFCHRLEKPCYWLASVLYPNENFDRQCLFGEHLLSANQSKPVMVVESPKNACLGAAICPNLVWVAAGNKGMLTPTLLEPLKRRNVIISPDMDALDSWKAIADAMGFKCLPPAPPKGVTECPPKWDIGDKIVETLRG